MQFDDFKMCVGWDKQDYYMSQLTKKILNGYKGDEIEMSDEDYDEAMNVLEERKRREDMLFRAAERNNRGEELERAGDIEGAIAVYEENIAEGYPASRSYDRLMILYRKRKDYDNEIRVILKTMEVFPTSDLSKRLAKAKELREKANK